MKKLNGTLSDDGTPPTFYPGASLAFYGLSKYPSFLPKGLLMQTDPRLENYGLLVPNGGLCVSTCVVNVLSTLLIDKINSAKTENLPQVIFKAYQYVSQKLGKDIRYGSSFKDIKQVFPEILKEITDTDIKVFGVHTYNVNEIDLQKMYPNRLRLAAVQTDANTSHAIVILGINTELKKITYSEPNNPNAIFVTSYHTTSSGGNTLILMDWNKELGWKSGYVLELFDIYLYSGLVEFIMN